jgi:hypothetical protein
MEKIVKLTESDLNRIVRRVINEDMSENTLYSDIMGIIDNSNSSHEETLSILRSIADEMESSRRLRRDVEKRFRGNMNEESDLNDPHFRLFVPEEFDGAIMELGPHPTPGTIIYVYNDIFQGDVSELVDFNEDLFLFYDAYGDEVTPDHIYELIDEFVKDEDSWDNDYNY